MYDLTIQSSSGEYSIKIGNQLVRSLPGKEIIVIADGRLRSATHFFGDRRIFIDVVELNKSLSTCESVIEEMKLKECNRGTTVIAIGGGFVQDVATLTSALYMRGLNWIFVPTTLMAMMDSCIGGKSSINVGAYKNLVGNFYPPREIVIDLTFVQTLDDVAIASGLSEGVKICFARGLEEFARFRRLRTAISSYDSATGAELIAHILNCKKWFVENDEFDIGSRQLLNFRHTFGHAIESSTDFEIPHGIGVTLGMLAAMNHPDAIIGDAEIALREECHSIIAPVQHKFLETMENFDRKKFERAILGDKKHTSTLFRLVLPKNGMLQVVEIERSEKAILNLVSAMELALDSVSA